MINIDKKTKMRNILHKQNKDHDKSDPIHSLAKKTVVQKFLQAKIWYLQK